VTDTEIQINGMAHVILCVSDLGTARKFYERLLPALGMTPVCDTDKLFYCVGGRTAIGIQPADAGERFVQGRVGLHHLCLRARSREDIDRLHDLLREMGATIIHAPQEGTWAPGYARPRADARWQRSPKAGSGSEGPSERFRSAPRTCGRFQGILSLL